MSYSVPLPAPAVPATHGKAATANAGKPTPPSAVNHMKRMPRVTLNPTTRVATVPVSPTVSYSSVPGQPNGTRAASVPRFSGSSATSHASPAVTHTIVDQQAVEAVQVAYEKTEAHLKAIEAKLSEMQAEMKRTASPMTPREPSTDMLPSVMKMQPQHALAPISSSATSANAPVKVAGANHHLQPIPPPATSPLVVPAPTVPPVKAVKAKTPTPPPPSQAPAAAAVAANKAADARGGAHPRFSMDDTNMIDSPNMSSGSDGSGSDSDSDGDSSSSGSTSGNDSTASHTLPVGAGKKAGPPARPPPAPSASNGAAPVRQGFGFKPSTQPASQQPASAGAGVGRRGIKVMNGNGPSPGESPQISVSSPFAGSLGSSGVQPEHRRAQSAGEQGEVVSLGRNFRRISGETNSPGDATSFFSPSGAAMSLRPDNAKAVDGMTSVTRKQTSAVKHAREHFFAPLPRFDEVLPRTEAGFFDRHDVEKLQLPGAPCSWLCCASLAISYVSGIPTSIEKVLRANRMGVHYISLPAITLAELFDVVNDYIHTRFHGAVAPNRQSDEFDEDEDAAKNLSESELKGLADIHCEMATFDTEVLEPDAEGDINGMGEHSPITNLAQFRKELVTHLNEENSTYIFNYDPYVMEQAQLRLRSNMCDTEEESAAIMAAARFPARNGGLFGILVSFDQVKHEAKVLTPYLTAKQHSLHFPSAEEGAAAAAAGSAIDKGAHHCRNMQRFAGAFANLAVEEQTVSLQALYESVQQVDEYSRLSRGFVRVFRSAAFMPKVPSIFPLFVLDGSSAGGLMTSVLDVKIAPHVLGLAMLHHLAVTFLLTDSARRKQSSRNLLSKANVCDVKLRGIPLTKICQQLRLPLSMIVTESNRASIGMAYVWYHFFLQQLQINQDVRIGLVLPTRRDDAEDGQPNITDTEFLDHLRLVIKSESVMLISFNVNIALNVRIDGRPEPAHFAIVIGLDEARGFVRLADVNVKRFRKTWHIPISRLYNAVMGFGYIVATKDKKVIKSLNGKQFQEAVLQSARNFLPPAAPTAYQRFEYPSRPYPLTVLADAVERLGFAGTNVERFLNFSGFHISYFLSRDMPLEGAAFVIQNYSHYALDDAVSVTTTHYDFYEGHPPPEEQTSTGVAVASVCPTRSEADLLAAIQHAIAAPQKRKLIVKYDVGVLKADIGVWNGSDGSSFAFVMDYEAPTKMVVLSDASASAYYRTFACPLSVLFTAVCSWDGIDMRARGTILLSCETSQESMYEDTKGYDMAHALVHHPFKPIFSAACSCLALAATEMMMNIETPALLGGAGVSFEDDEQKKYKRYNNIFSAEDFLYALPSFSVHDWRTQPVDTQDVVAMANNAFTTLKLPLRAVDVLAEEDGEAARTDAAALLRACSGVGGLLTMTLVAYDTSVLHGVPGASVGLVNRAAARDDDEDEDDEGGEAAVSPAGTGLGSVQLLEGDPCRWGACLERSAEELLRAVTGIYRVEEVIDEDEA